MSIRVAPSLLGVGSNQGLSFASWKLQYTDVTGKSQSYLDLIYWSRQEPGRRSRMSPVCASYQYDIIYQHAKMTRNVNVRDLSRESQGHGITMLLSTSRPAWTFAIYICQVRHIHCSPHAMFEWTATVDFARSRASSAYVPYDGPSRAYPSPFRAFWVNTPTTGYKLQAI